MSTETISYSRSINVSKEITASQDAVWKVLSDFPNISVWNTGVKTSASTNEQTSGIGAKRHCELTPVGTVDEEILEWDPKNKLVIEISSTGKLPIKNGKVTFELSETKEAATTTSVVYEYNTKWGPFGKMMGPGLDKQLQMGFEGFLNDLEIAAEG